MKNLIKEFKKLSFYKKISFLAVLFLLIFLPVATIIALQPKDIKKSKASEIEPTPTRTVIRITGVTGITGGNRTGTITLKPTGLRPTGPRPTISRDEDDFRIIWNGQLQPTATATPTLVNSPSPTPVSSIWVP